MITVKSFSNHLENQNPAVSQSWLSKQYNLQLFEASQNCQGLWFRLSGRSLHSGWHDNCWLIDRSVRPAPKRDLVVVVERAKRNHKEVVDGQHVGHTQVDSHDVQSQGNWKPPQYGLLHRLYMYSVKLKICQRISNTNPALLPQCSVCTQSPPLEAVPCICSENSG